MQAKWKDLIPFYVADTLSDRDKQAVEAYLLQCGAPCEDEVEEWRVIASATWQHVNTHSTELPPLSQAVLQDVAKDAPFRASNKIITSTEFHGDGQHQAPVYPRSASKQKRRRDSRFPLTMVAAFVTMVIFGGILLSQLTPDDLDPQTLVQITNVNEATLVTITDEFGGSTGIQPTNPNGSGILATPTQLAPQPSATFTSTPVPLPSEQALLPVSTLPPNSGGGLPSGACIVRNDTQGALTTYRNASFDADSVNVFPQGSQANITIVFNGWYMLTYGNWVSGDNVTVLGDCSQVWTATPTAIGDTNGGGSGGSVIDDGVPDCVVRNEGDDFVPLYQWADTNSPTNGRMAIGQESPVYIGENGWYQVFYAQWVNGADVTVIGAECNTLWIPTPTFQPGTTPLPTATGATLATVKVASTILQASPAEIGMFVEEVTQGTNLSVIAHNGKAGSQRWYLVTSPQSKVGWVSSLDVDISPTDAFILPAATVPFIPSATPTFSPSVTPTLENWSHITTVLEHGCGGTVGEQAVIPVQLQRLGSVVNLMYTDTQTSYTLNEVAPNSYSGTGGAGASIQINLSFTSSTSYTATEIVTHESGCIVRLAWAGTKQ